VEEGAVRVGVLTFGGQGRCSDGFQAFGSAGRMFWSSGHYSLSLFPLSLKFCVGGTTKRKPFLQSNRLHFCVGVGGCAILSRGYFLGLNLIGGLCQTRTFVCKEGVLCVTEFPLEFRMELRVEFGAKPCDQMVQ